MAKGFLDLTADTEAVEQALEGTTVGLKTIRRRMLSTAAQGVRRKINAAIRTTTTRHTGELLKAYRYKVRKDASQVNVFPRKSGSSNRIFPKAYVLNYGLEGTRHYARGFIEEGERYAESSQWEADANKMVQKELDKYWS